MQLCTSTLFLLKGMEENAIFIKYCFAEYLIYMYAYFFSAWKLPYLTSIQYFIRLNSFSMQMLIIYASSAHVYVLLDIILHSTSTTGMAAWVTPTS